MTKEDRGRSSRRGSAAIPRTPVPLLWRLGASAKGALIAATLLMPAAADAQMDSREGIALQNQILELRAQIEALRRSGGGAPAYAPPPTPRGPALAPSDLLTQLVTRMGELEEEVRRLRGRIDVAENANRQLQQDLEKLRGDIDFRLQQLEGGGRQGGARPPAAPALAAPAPGPQPGPPPQPPQATAPPPAPRTAERALAEGQAALARRDYAAAETAAREVLATRAGPRTVDAQLLLGEALAGRRDFQNAALAYNDAYTRSRQGSRAPEALLGLANAFNGFGAKREACDTLGQLQLEFPRLSGPLADRASATRRQAGCR